jgi:hypothetical protein
LLQTAANVAGTDWAVAYTATNSGTFTVLVSSFATAGSGTYRLHYLKVPGSFIVPMLDEGGAMVNGGNYDGTIDLGDLDPWTFTANAGDTIVLREGTTNFSPRLNLYGPSGSLLASAFANGGRDAYLSYAATSSGVFTVVVQDYLSTEQGRYRVHLMKIPGPYIVPAGDDGGPISGGTTNSGVTDIGDEDIWSFTAFNGTTISLTSAKLSGSSTYVPWLRLYGPTGALITNAGNATVSINYTPTNSGTFTLLVGSFSLGQTGT